MYCSSLLNGGLNCPLEFLRYKSLKYVRFIKTKKAVSSTSVRVPELDVARICLPVRWRLQGRLDTMKPLTWAFFAVMAIGGLQHTKAASYQGKYCPRGAYAPSVQGDGAAVDASRSLGGDDADAIGGWGGDGDGLTGGDVAVRRVMQQASLCVGDSEDQCL